MDDMELNMKQNKEERLKEKEKTRKEKIQKKLMQKRMDNSKQKEPISSEDAKIQKEVEVPKKEEANEKITLNEKPLDNFFNMNLDYFISILSTLKNLPNYKNKGPYIYCAVTRFLNLDHDLAELGEFLATINCVHAGIFECTKKILIHYGEEDENGNKKPLGMETKEDSELNKYQVRRIFFSEKNPEDFFDLIDKNEWTSEKYDLAYHNCIHCVNEYLILNNVYPIDFFIFNFAHFFLCDKCYNELTPERKKLYVKNDMNISDIKYQLYKKNGFIYENNPDDPNSELSFVCLKCMDDTVAQWRFEENLLQNTGEESLESLAFMGKIVETVEDIKHDFKKKIEKLFNEICKYFKIFQKIKSQKIPSYLENIENFKEEIKKYNMIGEPLAFALTKIKSHKIEKYQYAVVRKSLFNNSTEKLNIGFIALVSLNENKIIEYGNPKYNNGSPILRNIELGDKYIYHIVKKFQLNINIDELFNSINLRPWIGNRYDIYLYNSYNFINIYLNKFNQKLILRINIKSFNSAYLYLCRDCYKKFDHPNGYIQRNSFSLYKINDSNNDEQKDKYWWCWECGKLATFKFIGTPLNIKYDYLCSVCYYNLAEPKNYIKYRKDSINVGNLGLVGMMLSPYLLNNKEICRRCAKFDADYKNII